MKVKRKVVDQKMSEESKQRKSDSMVAFEAMMYIPVSLAQLEMALTGRRVRLQAENQGKTEKIAEEKIVSRLYDGR